MVSNRFFVFSDLYEDILIHADSRIRIFLYELDRSDFRPTPGSQHVYARFEGGLMAFETETLLIENTDILTRAVVWYGRYLDTTMEMYLQDPRDTGASCQRSAASL